MKLTLRQHTVRGRQPGPHLLITGGVHGDEFEPMAAIRQLIDEIGSAELIGTLTLVPVVNEPAFQRGHRCAEDNLDLARTCPGNAKGSITQRIAFALSDLIRAADFYVDLHTGGTTLSVLPLAGYMLHHDAHVLQQSRRMARAFNLPVIWGTDAKLEGRSLSVARDANVPAIYCEHYGAAVCQAEGVADYVSGCKNVLAELGMRAKRQTESRVQYVVEDLRTGSGHMQRCHPAQAAGYFQSDVQLGQIVQKGERLGTVVDVLGEQRQTVEAAEDGLVIVLRTFPAVAQGDSLAVLMSLASEHRR